MRRLLALLLCLLPLAASAQTSDKDFLTAFLEDNLSSSGRQVTITGFEGALSSRATMQEMTIADDQGIWLTVRDVTLDWSQSELLSGKVIIKEFSAGEILLDRVPPGQGGTSPEAGSFSVPDLPISIDIQKIEARRIALGETVLGQRVEGSLTAGLQLAGGEGAAVLDLLRRDDGPEGRFHLALAYARDTDRLTVELEAVEGAGGIAVSALGVPGAPAAELTVRGQGPSGGFDADVRLVTDGVTRLAGKVRSVTTEEGPGFTADLAGDPTPVFLPQYAAFFGPDVRLQAAGHRRADGGMVLKDFTLTTAALELQGQVALDAGLVPEVMALQGRLGLAEGPVVLPIATRRETRVTSANLSLRYDRAQGETWQAEAEVQGLDHQAFAAARLGLSGAGQILRTDEGARFDGLFDFAAEGLQMADANLATALGRQVTGRARADWQSGAALQITDLALKGSTFDLATTGTLGDLASGLTLAGTVTGKIADLAPWSGLAGQAMAGSVTLDLQGSTTLLTGAADLTGQVRGQGLGLGIAMLDRLMAGESVLDVSLKRDETGTALRALKLTLPGLTADLSGRIASDGAAIAGRVGLPDLGVLGAGLGGALTGSIDLSGPLEAPRLRLVADGKDVAMGQRQVDLLLKGDSRLDLDLGLKGTGGLALTRGEIAAEGVSILATGQIDAGSAALNGQLRLDEIARLGLGLSGAVQGDWTFSGLFASGSLALDGTATGLSTGAPTVDVLLAGQNNLALRLDLVPEGAALRSFEMTGPRMSLSATGMLGAQGQDLQVTHRIADLEVLVPGLPGSLESKGSLRHAATGFTLDLASRGPGQIVAETRGRLSPDLRQADLTITGKASAAVANGFAEPRSLSGNLRYDLRLQGPLALASLSGPVDLSGGRLADPAQTFGLVDMGARFTLSGGRAQVAGNARVTSGGTVTASGQIGLTAPFPGDIALSLTAVRLRDPELYATTVQGALTLKGPMTGGAVIAGTLDLGRTALRIPSTGFSADGGLPGLRHLAEPAASRATRERAGLMAGGHGGAQGGGRGFGLNLRINAPNQVFIRGRGLDAELGGSLVLTGRTDAMAPSGAFNLIRGRLDILGRRLTLSEALLQMQGRLVPFIRIAAAVDSGGITAQVQIEGPVDDPEVRFVSSPDLPQEEVLARLLFDRGLESLTAFQAIQLAGAVATLAGRGGEGMIGNLRRRAGVDNLDIQTDATGETAVTVGKYLSDKTYTEVTVGQAGKSSVSINLDLAPHVTLKGQLDSEGQTGIGVFLQRDY